MVNFLGQVFFRKEKGSPLTHEEMDSNFSVLQFLFDRGDIKRTGDETNGYAVEINPNAFMHDWIDGDGSSHLIGFIHNWVDNDGSSHLSSFIHNWVNNDGSSHLSNFIHNWVDNDGSSHLSNFIHNWVDNDGRKHLKSFVTTIPDDITTGSYVDGERVFDKTTNKTLTYYRDKLYDAMGNVEYDFTSSTQ